MLLKIGSPATWKYAVTVYVDQSIYRSGTVGRGPYSWNYKWGALLGEFPLFGGGMYIAVDPGSSPPTYHTVDFAQYGGLINITANGLSAAPTYALSVEYQAQYALEYNESTGQIDGMQLIYTSNPVVKIGSASATITGYIGLSASPIGISVVFLQDTFSDVACTVTSFATSGITPVGVMPLAQAGRKATTLDGVNYTVVTSSYTGASDGTSCSVTNVGDLRDLPSSTDGTETVTYTLNGRADAWGGSLNTWIGASGWNQQFILASVQYHFPESVYNYGVA